MKKLSIFCTCLLGIIALLLIAGEPADPETTFGRILLIKGIGLLILAACVLIIHLMGKSGYLQGLYTLEELEQEKEQTEKQSNEQPQTQQAVEKQL